MFESADVEKAVSFGNCLKDNLVGKAGLTLDEMITVVKQFGWYNQFVNKINDHVLEIKKQFSKPIESQTTVAPAEAPKE